ncbi:MAG: hypothetical protein JXB49_02130 [Bacteroidales bacterium]|nr:hypothetical protein [Bacteroidales bacterium]
MMKTALFLGLLIGLTLSSCKKDKDSDPDYCAGAWATEVSEVWADVITTASAYSTDPSQENCLAYKNAYQEYIDALEPFLNCQAWTPDQRAQLQQEIDEAEVEIATLCEE